ncbi:DUF2599 domain-containing protein [Streptomyces thioluteus]|uniref:DUF2599 domain-containing protein n=1 Tax=Streptomyces thioluteus TaxID=66431 RepID=UPI0031EBD3B4
MLLALTVQAPGAAADDAVVCGHRVQGAILAKYQEMGGESSPLGCPKTDELTTPNGVGRYNTFVGGSIYWSPDTGAHPVWGAIGDKWGTLGWEAGYLGFPAGDELANPDGAGRRQQFQGGTVYWHPTLSNGAHAVSGNIGWVWGAYNWESGAFGYPTSDVYWDKENKESYQKFTNNKNLRIFSNPNGNGVEGCERACAGYYGVVGDGPGDQATDLINETRVEIPLQDWNTKFVIRAWPTLKGRAASKADYKAGWDQMMSRVPTPWAMTPTMQSSLYKQFACHAVFSVPNPTKPGEWLGGPSWDLESWRSDVPWTTALNPLRNSKCNWD